jgi:hypothetical protein
MGFNPSSGALSCWRCGKKGPIDFIKAILGVSRSEASVLYGKYLVNGTRGGSFAKGKEAGATSIELPDNSFTHAELMYMKRRGITKEHREKFDIRSGGWYSDPWAYRIVLPIKVNGTIVSATGRAISRFAEPKYWTLPLEKEVIHHKHTFFNIDTVNELAIVVEGPLDALKGGDGFIASFGVNLTDEQMCQLLQFPSVLFLQDSDEAGDKFKEQAYRLSSLGHGNVELGHLPENFKDVGEMGENDIADLRRELGLGSNTGA